MGDDVESGAYARQQHLLEYLLNQVTNLADCVAELQEANEHLRARLSVVERAIPLQRPSTAKGPKSSR
jgi:hypothetical protein